LFDNFELFNYYAIAIKHYVRGKLMDLQSFMKIHNVEGPQGLARLLPSNFTRQQIAQYLVRDSVPCLENAIAIFLTTRGAVDFSDLLPKECRKYLPKDRFLLRTLNWESDVVENIYR